jgi:hypothetical protein
LTALSFYARKDNTASVNFTTTFNIAGSNPSSGTLTNTVTPTSTYLLYTMNLSALNLSGATSVTFTTTVNGGNGNQAVFFDNVSLTGVPEPTTVAGAVFGVGLLAVSGIRIVRRQLGARKV